MTEIRTSTLDNFYGLADNRVALGNKIIKDLEDLGYSFHDCRKVTRGEMTAPAELATDVSRLLDMKAEEAKNKKFAESQPELRPSPPAHGDWEATGWMEGIDFFGE